MKKQKISFIPASKEIYDFVAPPTSAKKNIPEWYKKANTDYIKKPVFTPSGRLENVSIKQCMPFFDAISSGYIQSTWCDIYIERISSNNINIISATKPEIIGSRDKVNIKYFDEEFYPNEFFWRVPWQPKTLKNHSVIICHPLNREDLPFRTLGGIIDSDEYFHGPSGNLPFYIKKGFSGLIPAGTPMYQYLPFERENWISVAEEYSEQTDFLSRIQVAKFWGFYKNNFWRKKIYE